MVIPKSHSFISMYPFQETYSFLLFPIPSSFIIHMICPTFFFQPHIYNLLILLTFYFVLGKIFIRWSQNKEVEIVAEATNQEIYAYQKGQQLIPPILGMIKWSFEMIWLVSILPYYPTKAFALVIIFFQKSFWSIQTQRSYGSSLLYAIARN